MEAGDERPTVFTLGSDLYSLIRVIRDSRLSDLG